MKKLLPLFIILLLLAGCAEPPVLEPTPVVLPTLRELTDPQTPTAWPHGMPETGFYNATVPKPVTYAGGSSRIAGPAGSVPFAGKRCAEYVYGDVDGDGQLELVCLAPGRTSGFLTQELYVYGLEDGWPVCKGAAVLYLFGSVLYGQDQFLIEADSQVLYRYDHEVPGEEYGSFPTATTLLPVRLENGSLRLAGDGDLPEGLECVSESPVFGASLAALTAQVGEDAFLRYPRWLVWRKTLEDPEGRSDFVSETVVMAAVSDNGVTVTGYLSWWPQEDGSVTCYSECIVPIPAQEDYEALARLSFDELQSDLGPYHADIGSGRFLPSWFTADGKLITANGDAAASSITIHDLLSGKHSYYEVVDADTIIILSGESTTGILNPERWSAFLEHTARGESDTVALRFNAVPAEDLRLSFDGSVYALEDPIGIQQYSHLIADWEPVEQNTAAHTQAAYRSVIHYLLSDDPDMTMRRYFQHALSSAYNPDFPNTCLLFSVYSYDDVPTTQTTDDTSG